MSAFTLATTTCWIQPFGKDVATLQPWACGGQHLNVERDNIDGDGDALVRNTSCGAAAAVVVFENVLQKSLRMWCKSPSRLALYAKNDKIQGQR